MVDLGNFYNQSTISNFSQATDQEGFATRHWHEEEGYVGLQGKSGGSYAFEYQNSGWLGQWKTLYVRQEFDVPITVLGFSYRCWINTDYAPQMGVQVVANYTDRSGEIIYSQVVNCGARQTWATFQHVFTAGPLYNVERLIWRFSGSSSDIEVRCSDLMAQLGPPAPMVIVPGAARGAAGGGHSGGASDSGGNGGGQSAGNSSNQGGTWPSLDAAWNNGGGNAPGSGQADNSCSPHTNEQASAKSSAPIDLLTGEKTLMATDLVVHSPAAPLTFQRSYVQALQEDGRYQFMGMGWTHNHAMQLSLSGTSPTRLAEIILADGGILKLAETSAGHFVAEPGATGVMDYASSPDEYVLVATDGSTYRFDGTTLALNAQTWSNGENWSYTYSSGKLITVADDYGRSLQFSYISNSGQFDHGQLWRVGDHTASGLTGSSPSGRYIEFGYLIEREDGNLVTGGKALLASVQDVRGETWEFDYYGQHTGETVSLWLNKLTRLLSPSVDITGDGSDDGRLTLQQLTYSQQIDLAVNGNMEGESGWTNLAGNAPTVNARSTIQVESDTYARRVVASAAGQGVEGSAWGLVPGRTYVVNARVYPVSGVVKMQVSSTSAFDQLSTGTGAWQTLSDTYTPSSASANHRLQFVAEGGAAEFYIDNVTIQEVQNGLASILQARGIAPGENALLLTRFNFQPQGENITEEIRGHAQRTHYFIDDIYWGTEDPAGGFRQQRLSARYLPTYREDANGNGTHLRWTIGGEHLASVTDAQGHETSFDYNTNGTLNFSLNAEGRKTTYTYGDSANLRLPTLRKVLDTNGTTVLEWLTYSYDSLGRLLTQETYDPTGTTLLRRTTRTYYADGNGAGLLASVTQHDVQNAANNQSTSYFYDAAGRVVKTQQTSLLGSCKVSYTVYDPAGNVVASICNFDLDVSGTPSASSSLSADYAASKAFDEQTTSLWRSNGLSGSGEWLQYDFGAGNAKTLSSVALLAGDAYLDEMPMDFTLEGSADNSTWNVVATVTGEVDWSAEELRVFGFSNSTAYRYWRLLVTDVDGGSNVAIGELDFIAANFPATAADAVTLRQDTPEDEQNRVTTYEYDSLGRRIKTTVQAGTAAAQTTLTVYDALGRVIRTIANFDGTGITHPYTASRSAFTHGSDNTRNLITETAYNERGLVRQQIDVRGNVTLYGYDAAGRVVKTIVNASDPNYDNLESSGDPTLGNYVPDSAPDADIIITSVYDANGNLVKTTDVLGQVTLYGYDALHRVIKTVRFASQPGYDLAVDPDLSGYTASSDPDQELITTTTYDGMGRVIRTTDELGNVTLYGYDPLGRQVKTIRNASQPAYNLTADPDLSAYTLSSATDEDLTALTTYDAQGRVLYTEDLNGQRTWFAYDGLGRQTRTIVNAVGTATNDGTSDPRSSSYIASSDTDVDLITETIYDSDGRVQSTLDVLGRQTWYGYDAYGRRVKTIRNCTYTSGSPAPSDDSYVGSPDSDKDLISRTVYDAQGRVAYTLDPRGNRTFAVYNAVGRVVRTVRNAKASATVALDPGDGGYVAANDPRSASYTPSSDADRDLITATVYDFDGRVLQTIDVQGLITQYEYDDLGRRVKTIVNYVNGAYNPAVPDEDLISETVFNKAGQVVSSLDARGTATAFTYDRAGRRLTVTQAAATPLATTSYTVYDKGGRVRRTIARWVGRSTAPEAQDGSGNWLFQPPHGAQADQNLIVERTLDQLGRVISIEDAVGNVTSTVYEKDGRVFSTTDALGIVSRYIYDKLRRLVRVVQSFQANGEEPVAWVWDSGQTRWEESDGTAIGHGTENDQNIIVETSYDKAGRRLSQRDPRGQLTTYTYDLLDRRTSLTNPLSETWTTSYADLTDGTQVTVEDPLTFETERIFDRAGRLTEINYLAESPKLTPDVHFTYDRAGNRLEMRELNGSTPVRITDYQYDDVRRLIAVAFDTDGDADVDQTVSYAYDAGGLRTRLTLPGGLDVIYVYNERGQLVSLTDWDDQTTRYTYDGAGRLQSAQRNTGFSTQYRYDANGRLRDLHHLTAGETLKRYRYTVDGRGNRVQVQEMQPGTTPTIETLLSSDARVDYYKGSWATSGAFKVSADFSAKLRLEFVGKAITITLGNGTDHGICDIYIDQTFWGSRNTYHATDTEETFTIVTYTDVPHRLEIRNRADQHPASTGRKLRFKQVAVTSDYAVQTLQYAYDALSRLLSADYFIGTNVAGTPFRSYDYGYDRAGNRLAQAVFDGTTTTTTNYTYNAANQLIEDGTHDYGYDANGNLITTDTLTTHVWDRANRLLAFGGSAYTYNGAGQRVSQEVSSIVTQYLLDTQPGLYKVLAATAGSDTTRFVHGATGIHAQESPDGKWRWMVQDGLGSVTGVVDEDLTLLENRQYAPYGEVWEQSGTEQTPYEFTGEWVDDNELLYLRARYYNPGRGSFVNLDPIETPNRYEYALSNPINWVDRTGFDPEPVCTPNSNAGTTTCVASPITLEAEAINPDYHLLNNELYTNFKVYLTIACGQNLDNSNWSTYISRIRYGLIAIASRIQEYGYSFEEVFGNLEFRLHADTTTASISNTPPLTPAQVTVDGKVVEWYVFGLENRLKNDINQIAVHELGHIFDNRTDGKLQEMITTYGLTGSDFLGLAINPDKHDEFATEIMADHFLNWVYLSYTKPEVNDAILYGTSSARLYTLGGDSTKRVIAYWLGLPVQLSITEIPQSIADEAGIYHWLNLAKNWK